MTGCARPSCLRRGHGMAQVRAERIRCPAAIHLGLVHIGSLRLPDFGLEGECRFDTWLPPASEVHLFMAGPRVPVTLADEVVAVAGEGHPAERPDEIGLGSGRGLGLVHLGLSYERVCVSDCAGEPGGFGIYSVVSVWSVGGRGYRLVIHDDTIRSMAAGRGRVWLVDSGNGHTYILRLRATMGVY